MVTGCLGFNRSAKQYDQFVISFTRRNESPGNNFYVRNESSGGKVFGDFPDWFALVKFFHPDSGFGWTKRLHRHEN